MILPQKINAVMINSSDYYYYYFQNRLAFIIDWTCKYNFIFIDMLIKLTLGIWYPPLSKKTVLWYNFVILITARTTNLNLRCELGQFHEILWCYALIVIPWRSKKMWGLVLNRVRVHGIVLSTHGRVQEAETAGTLTSKDVVFLFFFNEK
jgi:hypothetical protein